MVKIVVGLVLVAHGIGHTMGFFPAIGWARSSFWTGDSWLLTPALGDAARWIALPLWAVATAGFVALGASLIGVGLPAGVARQVALMSSIASLALVAFFANGFASPVSAIGAAAVDILVLTSLFMSWPVSELAGT